MHQKGLVPDYFALTVGWGDVITGTTAPVVALAVWRKVPAWWGIAAAWTAFAALDLVHSAAAATLSSDTPLRVLPLLPLELGRFPGVLLAVYLVPLAVVGCTATALRLAEFAGESSSER